MQMVDFRKVQAHVREAPLPDLLPPPRLTSAWQAQAQWPTERMGWTRYPGSSCLDCTTSMSTTSQWARR